MIPPIGDSGGDLRGARIEAVTPRTNIDTFEKRVDLPAHFGYFAGCGLRRGRVRERGDCVRRRGACRSLGSHAAQRKLRRPMTAHKVAGRDLFQCR